MKKTTFISVILLVCLCGCFSAMCFVGCAQPENVNTEVALVVDGKRITGLTEKAEGEWYADVSVGNASSGYITDPANHSHTVTFAGSKSGEYTVFLTQKGKNYVTDVWAKRRAMIWVTALLSGGLYDSQTNAPAWDPLPYDDVFLGQFIDPSTMGAAVGRLVRKILFGGGMNLLVNPIVRGIQTSDNLFWNLGLDNYGVPHNPNLLAANGYDGRVQYGVLGAYTEHSTELKDEFSADTDVVIFNYDWRFDNRDSVNALEKYIADNKYTDVLMFSHSLGGNIVAGYLAKNSFNRDRVSKYVSMGGAFLGSFDALYTLEDIKGYLLAVVDNMNAGDVVDTVSMLLKYFSADVLSSVVTQAQDFIVNMYSFVQLLPSYPLISGKQYGVDGDGDAITVNGTVVSSEAELYAFYESRPWAWQRDENNEYVMDGDKHVLREVVKDLKNYHDSLYVTQPDGTKVFATTLVDTYYLTGTGIITFCGADYSENAEGVLRPLFRLTTNGDKQVLLYSTLINQDPQPLRDSGHLIEYAGSDHFQVGCSWNLVRPIVREFLYDFIG